MQLFLPSPINFGVTPGAIALDSLVGSLYNRGNLGRPYRYPASPYGRGVSGLGFDYYDLLDEAGLESCSPRDEACVGRNQQRQVAVEDVWVTQYMTHGDTAGKVAPVLTVNTDNSAWATSAFLANQPMTSETIQIDGGPAHSDAQYEALYAKPAAVAASKPNQSVPPTSQILPMATGFQNTAQAILKQQAAGSPVSPPAEDTKIFGMDQKTFLAVAGVGAAALFFMGRRQ